MTRDELIQVGVAALPPLAVWRELMMEDVVEYVLDAVEEKIRADERGRLKQELWPMIGAAEADVRADLRAKVEALRYTESGGYGNAINDVLDLIDGSSDD